MNHLLNGNEAYQQRHETNVALESHLASGMVDGDGSSWLGEIDRGCCFLIKGTNVEKMAILLRDCV
jgi:hypothetical protein